ncbi:MAG TPA: caspase family protein [Chloroflexia bacterium]|jgi:hypothetical protein
MALDNAHALVVGVGAYADSRLSAPITAKDAGDLADTLRSDSVGYPAGNVTTLTNEKASRSGILQALDELGKHTDKESTVLVLLCGHGIHEAEGSYYFLPYDTRIGGDQIDSSTGISSDELASSLKNIASKKMLVLFNTCFSGYMAGSLGASRPAADEAGLAGLAAALDAPSREAIASVRDAGEGRVVISACRSGQKSWYRPGDQNTIFVNALLSGLRGASGVPNRGGYVGVFELYDYVWERVSTAVRAIAGGLEQEPVLTSREVVGPFAVALYRGGSLGVGGLEGERPAPQEAVPLLNKEPTVGGTAVEIVRQQITNTATQGGVVSTGTMGNVSTGAGAQFNNQGEVRAGGDVIQGSTVNRQQYGGVQFHGTTTIGGNVAGGDITISTGSSGLDPEMGKQLGELLRQLKATVDAEPALSPDARFEVIGQIRAAEAELDKPDAAQTLRERISTVVDTVKAATGSLAATGTIYNVLRPIANIVGISLP